ncbi:MULTISPECIES: hypothetical protein [unclassified Chryseobacterium]|uniref:hypothetical protein n=1 Tax=unclassified Chryseobacterium TaxID=2593645 RepID=UPI0008305A9C|nr:MULTISPECIES: hypothetical protein [unclassified Chryseobacterium]
MFDSKQTAGNKAQLTEVSNRLWETKFNCGKFQTNCGKQNTIAGSLKQIVGNKMKSQEVSNQLQETKHS